MHTSPREFTVGDKVAIISRGSGFMRRSALIWSGTVSATHKTGHVIANNQKFRRDGRPVRARDKARYYAFSEDRLEHWTPELALELEQQEAEQKAERACQNAAATLRQARGAEAVRLAAFLPAELTEPPS